MTLPSKYFSVPGRETFSQAPTLPFPIPIAPNERSQLQALVQPCGCYGRGTGRCYGRAAASLLPPCGRGRALLASCSALCSPRAVLAPGWLQIEVEFAQSRPSRFVILGAVQRLPVPPSTTQSRRLLPLTPKFISSACSNAQISFPLLPAGMQCPPSSPSIPSSLLSAAGKIKCCPVPSSAPSNNAPSPS